MSHLDVAIKTVPVRAREAAGGYRTAALATLIANLAFFLLKDLRLFLVMDWPFRRGSLHPSSSLALVLADCAVRCFRCSARYRISDGFVGDHHLGPGLGYQET